MLHVSPSPSSAPAAAHDRPAAYASQAPRGAVPTRLQHAADVMLGAASYAGGAATSALYLAPRLAHPGYVGTAILALGPACGWLQRHVAHAELPAAHADAEAPVWAVLKRVMLGVVWGFVLPAAFGPLRTLGLGLATASAAAAWLVDAAAMPAPAPSLWQRSGDAAHLLACAATALWLQLRVVQAARDKPAQNAPRAEQTMWRLERAQAVARAQQAWQSLGAQERIVWQYAPSVWPPNRASLSVWGKTLWTAACAAGALGSQATLWQTMGIVCAVGLCMQLPKSAVACMHNSASTRAEARDAGQTLGHHLLGTAFAIGAYAH